MKQRFEYKVLEISAKGGFFSSGGVVDFQALSDKLNELGAAGWEVVSSTDVNRYQGETRNVMIILKRKLEEQAAE